VTLEGRDHVPRGYRADYGADFDVAGAAWWLRLWFRTPFVDRYTHPRLVRRGLGHLTPFPDRRDEDRETGPWRLAVPRAGPAATGSGERPPPARTLTGARSRRMPAGGRRGQSLTSGA
jgi:hypothetical protein